jgi:hypothetical protein
MDNNDSRSLELLAIHSIMSTKDGRQFMWRVLEQCGEDTCGFISDPYINAFNSGRRFTGIWLRDELKEASSDHYVEMIRENIE